MLGQPAPAANESREAHVQKLDTMWLINRGFIAKRKRPLTESTYDETKVALTAKSDDEGTNGCGDEDEDSDEDSDEAASEDVISEKGDAVEGEKNRVWRKGQRA